MTVEQSTAAGLFRMVPLRGSDGQMALAKANPQRGPGPPPNSAPVMHAVPRLALYY